MQNPLVVLYAIILSVFAPAIFLQFLAQYKFFALRVVSDVTHHAWLALTIRFSALVIVYGLIFGLLLWKRRPLAAALFAGLFTVFAIPIATLGQKIAAQPSHRSAADRRSNSVPIGKLLVGIGLFVSLVTPPTLWSGGRRRPAIDRWRW